MAILLLSGSCRNYGAAEPAFFIMPTAVSVQPEAGQGSGSHAITDLWLYVNGQFQGCYPASGRLPVMSQNKQARVQIFAGIRNNGISTTRVPWPFYRMLQIDTLAEQGVNVERPLTFSYSSAATFTLTEDFEGGVVQHFTPEGALFEEAPAADSFEGRSMRMKLDPAASTGRIRTASAYALPRNNSNVYLEMNYKTNALFHLGVIDAQGRERAALVVNPKNDWNKLYVQLAQVVSEEPASEEFRLYFRIDRLEGQHADPTVFLDNIKLVFIK